MLCEDPPLCEAFAHVLVAQIHQNLVEEKMTSRGGLRTTSELMFAGCQCTFPRRPLCLESRLPPFFTATSRVLLWSSTRETVNSNLRERRNGVFRAGPMAGEEESARRRSRLVVNRVQVSLERVSFPPA